MKDDLFPDTLICYVRNGVVYTNSVNVANYSKKRHKDVLKAIENKMKVLPIGFNGRNFAPVEYVDAKGERRKMYEMTEEGFALTMMGFTGKEAVQWQVDFIEEFMAQRAVLAQLTARFAQVTDVIRPSLRPTVEGTEAGLNRAAIAERLGKSVNAVSYHRSQARRFKLI